MIKLLRIAGFIALLSVLPSMCIGAGVSDLLNDIYAGKGRLSNVTKPQVVQGQQAGYLTGGSLVTRSPSKTLHPVGITLPKVRTGCQGIDFYTGGLSFANTKAYEDTLKSIANGTVAYATQMALKSLSPMMADTLNLIKTVTDEVNRFNINSCEMSSLLVSAAAPKLKTVQHHACAQLSTQHGKIADYAKAKHECQAEGQQQSSLERAPRDKQQELRFNINLIWDALKKKGMTISSQSMSEWMMSLSGTKVYRKTGDALLPSLFLSDPNDWLHSLLHGGTIKQYHCDESQRCLSPSSDDVVIAPSDGLTAKVDSMMHAIVQKIQTGELLTASEAQFISNVSLPVYKLLDLSTMTSSGQGYIDVGTYSEIIALDWLLTGASQLAFAVQSAASTSGLDGEDMVALSENIKSVIKQLQDASVRAFSLQGGQMRLLTLIGQLETYRGAELAAKVAHNLTTGEK